MAYALMQCKCGGNPRMIMKIPKRREWCRVVCDKCGEKTDLFTAEYQAAVVWNSGVRHGNQF